MAKSNAWDRLPNESLKAFEAFTAYRDLPPATRSIDAAFRAVSGQHGSKKRASGRFTAWSSNHRWVERAAAWNAHLDSEAQAELIEEAKAARKAKRLLSKSLVGRLATGMKTVNFDHMTPGELIRNLRAAFSMQFEALGIDETGQSVHGMQGTTNEPLNATDIVGADPSPDRFELPPDLLAAGLMILQTHESVPDPEADKKPSDGGQAIQPDAPAGGESCSSEQ